MMMMIRLMHKDDCNGNDGDDYDEDVAGIAAAADVDRDSDE